MSFADWTLYAPAQVTIGLNSDKFVSAPSSLRFKVYGSGEAFLLSSNPAASNIKQGSISSYFCHSSATWNNHKHVGFVFGWQDSTHYHIVKKNNISPDFYLYRVSWWDTYSPDNIPSTGYIFERNVAGYWYDLESGYLPCLSGSVNKCGLYIDEHFTFPGTYYIWFDDTSIYI